MAQCLRADLVWTRGLDVVTTYKDQCQLIADVLNRLFLAETYTVKQV